MHIDLYFEAEQYIETHREHCMVELEVAEKQALYVCALWENLRHLSAFHSDVTVHIPLILGVNDSLEDMEVFGRIIKDTEIKKIELLRYNYMAESKYQMVGLEYESFGSKSQSDSNMKLLCEKLQNCLQGKNISYR